MKTILCISFTIFSSFAYCADKNSGFADCNKQLKLFLGDAFTLKDTRKLYIGGDLGVASHDDTRLKFSNSPAFAHSSTEPNYPGFMCTDWNISTTRDKVDLKSLDPRLKDKGCQLTFLFENQKCYVELQKGFNTNNHNGGHDNFDYNREECVARRSVEALNPLFQSCDLLQPLRTDADSNVATIPVYGRPQLDASDYLPIPREKWDKLKKIDNDLDRAKAKLVEVCRSDTALEYFKMPGTGCDRYPNLTDAYLKDHKLEKTPTPTPEKRKAAR